MQTAEEFLQTENTDEDTRAEFSRSINAAWNASRWMLLFRMPRVMRTNSKMPNSARATGCANPSRLIPCATILVMMIWTKPRATTAERDKLVKSELPQYEQQIARQRSLAEQELVENFIHRLREQIEDARQQLSYLNNTLSGLRFGGERLSLLPSRPGAAPGV
jgi:hypothetical protein